MERIRDRVAGLDVHRDTVVGCLRLAVGGEVQMIKQSFSTMSSGVAKLADWLADHQVSTAVMEATGVYSKPIYYGLEGLVDELWLVNAAHVKRVPGRKTDAGAARRLVWDGTRQPRVGRQTASGGRQPWKPLARAGPHRVRSRGQADFAAAYADAAARPLD